MRAGLSISADFPEAYEWLVEAWGHPSLADAAGEVRLVETPDGRILGGEEAGGGGSS